MRSNLKMFGAEVLYLLAAIIVAGLATVIQTVGRSYEGDYSSSIWSGSEYRYNPFFYMLGLALFVGFMLAGYRFFLKKRITALAQTGVMAKIVFLGFAVVFSLLMLAAIVYGLFLVTGLTDNMRPDWALKATGFGWPIFCVVFMILVEVLAVINKV